MKKTTKSRQSQKGKIEELWKLNMQLRSLALDPDEEEIDDAVNELFDEDPPLWLTNSIVFASIFAIYDEKIDDEIYKLSQLQKLLKVRLNGAKEEEKRKQALLEDISRLESLTLSNESQLSSTTDYNIDLQIQEYDRICRNKRARLHELEEEEEELEAELEKCDQDLEKVRNERDMFQSQLQESSNIIRQFRKKNEEIQKFIKTIVGHRNALHKRQKDLTILGDTLLKAKADNEKNIKRLEEKYGKHQQLVQEIEEIEEKIRAKEKKQEMTLTKMIEAVKSAEMCKAEVLKQSAINQNLLNEVNRINELTRDSAKRLSSALEDHQNSIIKNFENVLNQLQASIKDTETQNKDIVQDRGVVQRRVDLALAENAKLIEERGDNGFTQFMKEMSRIQDEIDNVILQINQLKATNDRIADSISSTKTKILHTSKDYKEDSAQLKQKEEYLHSQIEEYEEQVAEMIEHNEKINGENQELRASIINCQKDSLNEMKQKLAEKEDEIEAMKKEIKIAQEESRRAIENINIASQGYKKHADKWRCQLEIIGTEANDYISNVSSSFKNKKDEIKQLRQNILHSRQMNEDLQYKQIEMDKQIVILKGQLAETNSRIRRYERRLRKTEEQGMNFFSNRDEMQRMLKSLDTKINRLGAELYVIKNQD